jgi:hypothetical protein
MALSSSVVARSSAADRSGKTAGPALEAQPGIGKFAEYPVELTPIRRDDDVSQRGTRLGVRRAFACVVAALELAVGTLEGVLVEDSLIGDALVKPASPLG